MERDDKGRFLPGHQKLGGRKEGKPNFTTEWFAFIERIAATKKMSADEVEDQLRIVAFQEMQRGNYSFWRDINDRIYGGALAKLEHSGKVETEHTVATPEIMAVVTEFNDKLRDAISAKHKKPEA